METSIAVNIDNALKTFGGEAEGLPSLKKKLHRNG